MYALESADCTYAVNVTMGYLLVTGYTFAVYIVYCMSTTLYCVAESKCAVAVIHESECYIFATGNKKFVALDTENFGIIQYSACYFFTEVTVCHKTFCTIGKFNCNISVCCELGSDYAVKESVLNALVICAVDKAEEHISGSGFTADCTYIIHVIMFYCYTTDCTVAVCVVVFVLALTKVVTESIGAVAVGLKCECYLDALGYKEFLGIDTFLGIVEYSRSCAVTGIAVGHIPIHIVA